MTFDSELLSPILREFDEKRLQYETSAARRRAQVYEQIPRIAEIDSLLRSTILDIIKSTFSSGQDAAPMIGAVREHNLELQRERAELLVSHGYSYDYMDVHYDCAHCSDTGYVDSQPCSCLMDAYRKAQERVLSEMFAGASYSFDDFSLEYYSTETIPGVGVSAYEQMEEVYNFCVEYAKHFDAASENLYMSGASGLGKTMLACCIAREVVARGSSVVYDTAFSVFSAFEDEKFGRADASATASYRNCDLLILDDLGTEMTTAYTTSVLYNLINTRLLSGKKTVICSNLSLSDVQKRYGSQIYSRLSGDYLPLLFCGTDIRKIKRSGI